MINDTLVEEFVFTDALLETECFGGPMQSAMTDLLLIRWRREGEREREGGRDWVTQLYKKLWCLCAHVHNVHVHVHVLYTCTCTY